jgi:hypothetical protein
MIYAVIPRELDLAHYAIRLALEVVPGRSTDAHLRAVWNNFCYSFRDFNDFINQYEAAAKRQYAARLAKYKARR